MDPEAASNFIDEDSKYVDASMISSQTLRSIDIGDRAVSEIEFKSIDDPELAKILNPSMITQDGSRVIFIPIKRVFQSQSSMYCRFSITRELWLRMLHSVSIPPNVLELLHDHAGGHTSFVTHCNDDEDLDSGRCAYHVCVKVCTWLGEEHFLYARHDFHTKSNLFIVATSSDGGVAHKLISHFEGQSRPHLLSVVLAVTTAWVDTVRAISWNLDCATQRMESETGFTNLSFQAIRPLSPQQLSLKREFAAVRQSLRAAARATNHLGDIFAFLKSEIANYQAAHHPHHVMVEFCLTKLDKYLLRAYQQRLDQNKAQYVQLTQLIRRLDTQWEAVNALMAAHNNQLMIGMAQDSRSDSVLMRRIALVTIIFLPATFMATFFSMSFFHVADGNLNVSRWIWLHAVCTVPLTLVLGLAYGNISERLSRWHDALRGGINGPKKVRKDGRFV
jgi:Mg2+ and Co2+ transporter CorA